MRTDPGDENYQVQELGSCSMPMTCLSVRAADLQAQVLLQSHSTGQPGPSREKQTHETGLKV